MIGACDTQCMILGAGQPRGPGSSIRGETVTCPQFILTTSTSAPCVPLSAGAHHCLPLGFAALPVLQHTGSGKDCLAQQS